MTTKLTTLVQISLSRG